VAYSGKGVVYSHLTSFIEGSRVKAERQRSATLFIKIAHDEKQIIKPYNNEYIRAITE
jgi:hypothetical protein